MHFVNYAHRGASEYAPENTLAAFYLGLEMGADGIETDIQRTRDGVLVLFHDQTMQRILGLETSVKDHTYHELLAYDFGKYKGLSRYTSERIVRFEDFLHYFGEKNLSFALEIKQEGVESDALAMVHRFGIADKVTFTSFIWDSLVKIRELDPHIAIGFLTESITPQTLELLDAYGMRQICPRVGKICDNDLRLARERGFSVRGWGIANTELMREAIRQKLDGITVNFPDLLTQALTEGV